LQSRLKTNAIVYSVITYSGDFVAVLALVWTFGIVDDALAVEVDEQRGPFLPVSYQELLASHEQQNPDRNIFQALVERVPKIYERKL
jgi:hypothetical protein